MTQKTQNFFICFILLAISLKANQICQQLDPQSQTYPALALTYATEKLTNDLDKSVAQIFQISNSISQNYKQTFNLDPTDQYSFNVYKFTNDQGSVEKKKQLELHLRYMLFFRKAFEFKHLSDNGCYVYEQNQVTYVVLQFPGERVEVNEWFQGFDSTGRNFFQITTEEYTQLINDLKYQKESIANQINKNSASNSSFQITNEEYNKLISDLKFLQWQIPNLVRKQLAFNPFFSMDISLQFLIALAKMHQKNILHLNIKPFNLKLLNRYSLALDNFENSIVSFNGQFDNSQQFSQNPYNGKNVADQNISQLDFTDDLHSAALTIYQICTFKSLPNDKLFDEIKSNFQNLEQNKTNVSLFNQTKQWCGKLVHTLLFSNGRITQNDIQNLDQNTDYKKLNDGADAVKELLTLMIEMKQQYQSEFQQYFSEKLNYLNSNQISSSTRDFKDKLQTQTQNIQSLIADNEIESLDMNEVRDKLLTDTEIDSKNPLNIYKYLPEDIELLDITSTISLEDDIPSECQDSQQDITIQCLDTLFSQQDSQFTEIQEAQNFQFQYQKADYEKKEVIQALDFMIDSEGYNTQNLVMPNNGNMQFPGNFSSDYLII